MPEKEATQSYESSTSTGPWLVDSTRSVWTLQDVWWLLSSLLLIGLGYVLYTMYEPFLTNFPLMDWDERLQLVETNGDSLSPDRLHIEYDWIAFSLPANTGPAYLRDRIVVETHRFNAFFKRGEYQQCLQSLDNVKELFDGYPVYQALLLRRKGITYLAMGNFVAAEKAFARLLHHYQVVVPEQAEACWWLAQTYEKQGRCEDAAVCYREAVSRGGPHHYLSGKAADRVAEFDSDNAL